jgi:dTDP-4-amino-4,6-dideoxygalactose transaminase
MPMYRRLASADPKNLPVAQRAAKQVLCLPIYPELSFSACDMIIAAIRDSRTG